MTFRDQVVWITGASSGLGRELAIAFARKGALLALSARRAEELEDTARMVRSAGGEAECFVCDVRDEAALEQCAAAVARRFGRMDVAVANAGFGVVGPVVELSAEEWQRQFAINVTGLALTARFAFPHLRINKGRMVLIGSVAAFLPGPRTGAYAASKAAVHNIGETLQLEWKESGVTCTTIHPGFVESNITRVDNDGVFDASRKDPRPAFLMWPADRAARSMLRAIYRRKKVHVFTGHGKLLAFLGRHFPALARWIMHQSSRQVPSSKAPR